jgi:hypothetical protein
MFEVINSMLNVFLLFVFVIYQNMCQQQNRYVYDVLQDEKQYLRNVIDHLIKRSEFDDSDEHSEHSEDEKRSEHSEHSDDEHESSEHDHSSDSDYSNHTESDSD